MSETSVRETVSPVGVSTDSGDHDLFAHYVFGRNAPARVTEAIVTGTPVTALCGKRWVPSRDASRFPICPSCKKVREALQRKA